MSWNTRGLLLILATILVLGVIGAGVYLWGTIGPNTQDTTVLQQRIETLQQQQVAIVTRVESQEQAYRAQVAGLERRLKDVAPKVRAQVATLSAIDLADAFNRDLYPSAGGGGNDEGASPDL